MTLLLDARSRQPPHPPETARTADQADVPGDRPVPLPREVIALQMEDHYVRVHTAAGSVLVHMPLTRAIEQVAPLDGLRTHRSWWVARHAIVGTPDTEQDVRKARGFAPAPHQRQSL